MPKLAKPARGRPPLPPEPRRDHAAHKGGIVSDWMSTGDIAKLIGLSRAHVTDVITKRPDFPKPVVNLSERLRRWDRDDVMSFFTTKPKR